MIDFIANFQESIIWRR